MAMRFQFSLYFFLLAALAGCQGTSVGGIVGNAIAPRNAPIENLALPVNFPTDIPLFRQASLQDLQQSSQKDAIHVTSRWLIREPSPQVVQFYREALRQNGWHILRSSDLSDSKNSSLDQIAFLAERNDLLVTISMQPIPEGTSLLLQYVRLPQSVPNNTPNNVSGNLSKNDFGQVSGQLVGNMNASSNGLPRNRTDTANFSIRLFGFTRSFANLNAQSQIAFLSTDRTLTAFLPSDLYTAPVSLRAFVKDICQLGAIAPTPQNNFEPYRAISRREYARWLAVTNNRIHQNRPSRQIRLAESTDTPTFTDIPRNDPDFSIIQGLANAGLIRPNPETANNTPTLFRPDAQITREELLHWKVPLDVRRPLPAATVETVNQAWGFQDSDRISPFALKAIFADAQSGDLSNIRRSFGFTTLFQPQKAVTRAEAAAVLWYFGTQADGLSIQSFLESEKATTNPTNPAANNTSTTTNPSASPSPNRVSR
jgi:hypothetical protein